MSLTGKSVEGSGSGVVEATGRIDWREMQPLGCDFADALPKDKVAAKWLRLYREAGVATSSEAVKAQLRAAVYLYCFVNGSSSAGTYSGSMQTRDGTSCEAAIIPRAFGSNEVRHVLRACMDESYMALKSMDLTMLAARRVSELAARGINSDVAFATADWMRACRLFTPEEAVAHDKVFQVAVKRAVAARGGKSLEEVREERANAEASAGGYDHASGGPIVF